MVDKALAFQFGGEGSNPAETCREAAGSDVSVIPMCMGSRLSLRCVILRSYLVETCEEADHISAPKIRGNWTVSS